MIRIVSMTGAAPVFRVLHLPDINAHLLNTRHPPAEDASQCTGAYRPEHLPALFRATAEVPWQSHPNHACAVSIA